MKITRRQLRKLISEAMFDAPTFVAKAKARVKQALPADKMSKLDDMLKSKDEETARQAYNLLDSMGGYESATDDSYDDIKYFDQTMEDATKTHRALSAAGEFERQYMPNMGTDLMTALYKIADTPDVHLYVTSNDQDKNFRAPSSEVVKYPLDFGLIAIATDNDDFSEAVTKGLEIGHFIAINVDDQDAIMLLLEKMAGDNVIGHVPPGHEFSPEDAFLAWITQNNPSLKIYVDP